MSYPVKTWRPKLWTPLRTSIVRSPNLLKDPSLVAAYEFNEPNIGVDLSGKENHLTNVGVTYLGGAKFVRAEGDYLYRPDTNLSAGFPGTAGYTDLAIYCEFTLASLPQPNEHYSLAVKRTSSAACWWITYYRDSSAPYNVRLYFVIGINEGTNWEFKQIYLGDLDFSRHMLGISFDDSAKSGYFKLVRSSDGAVLADSSFSTANNMNAEASSFYVGTYDAANHFFDGTIHSLYISNTPKTEADFDAMANRTY